MFRRRAIVIGYSALLGLIAATSRGDGPAPPAEAAARMTVPEGFRVTLFAAEPDVRQPIAFAIDARGRLWVAENYSYPNWRTKPEGRDRIIILEDSDGDGRFDKRKVFWDGGANLTGLALGFGGVWACETPNLVFIPDRDGDDVPDGPAVVELDGWDVKGQHNLFNALSWGPDGWLHGCNGIMSNSLVGRPGTSDRDRVALNCGVWRYHPTRKVFEVVAHGTTNPWGLDFDDHGQAFITNCVIPHAYRVVPGAHFIRMFGQDINPFSYGLMGTAADHLHWAGGSWTDSRGGQGKHGEAGGGHAHVGAMVYLGDNWPARYRDTLFTCNLHGNRVNNDALRREGSGYVATHSPDFLKANDPWFRGMELKSGPDGGVYLTDWSDTGECHETDADGPHRENGRIYKITHGEPKKADPVDLARLDDVALARLQSHPNEWHVRTARRLLQERAASGKDMADAHAALRGQLSDEQDVPRRLRSLWTLHVTGGLQSAAIHSLLLDSREWVRAWAVRLAVDAGPPPAPTRLRFAAMAKDDPSLLVRLELASALQKIPVGQRGLIAENLASGARDADDPSLSLMIWYGIEPTVPLDRAGAADLAVRSGKPLIRRFLARRIVAADDAAGDGRGVAAAVARVVAMADPRAQADLLGGVREALRGRKSSPTPEGWPAAFDRLAASPDPGVRDLAVGLALQFDDPRALATVKAMMLDATAPAAGRLSAVGALAERRTPGLAGALQGLLREPALRAGAIRALASYDDPATPAAILGLYPGLSPAERVDAVATLASRPAYALGLLDAVRAGSIPRRDVSTATARQLLAMNDRRVAEALGPAWGTIRATSAEKGPMMARYKAILGPDRLKGADPGRGRAVFRASCVACHRLFDEGNDLGPELTGSDRANADYVLENVLDPSASVGREYRATTVALKDGRVLSGLLQDEGGRTLAVRTTNDRVVLDRDDVEEVRPSDRSLMPEGLFENLGDAEVRDLVAYLAAKAQVPAPTPSPNP